MRMSALVVALVVFVVGMAATAAWFVLESRSKEEPQLGVKALAGMKWRQCVGLVIESLIRDGYAADERDSLSSEGSEFMLRRNDEKVLSVYKHGTAYRISEDDVREFASRVTLKGAKRGLLITLGTIDAKAVALAARLNVEVHDGKELWSRLGPYMSESVQAAVASGSLSRSHRSVWIGASASVAAALLTFLVVDMASGPAAPDAATAARGTIAASARPATDPASARASDLATKQLEVARQALAEIASLSDADKARRRAEAAKQISTISQVRSANWSAQSTLLLVLNRSDGKDEQLVDEACRVLVGYEELRYSRLQLQPPDDDKLPVRWKQCN
jgi:hypothetical protein